MRHFIHILYHIVHVKIHPLPVGNGSFITCIIVWIIRGNDQNTVLLKCTVLVTQRTFPMSVVAYSDLHIIMEMKIHDILPVRTDPVFPKQCENLCIWSHLIKPELHFIFLFHHHFSLSRTHFMHLYSDGVQFLYFLNTFEKYRLSSNPTECAMLPTGSSV